MEAVIGQGHHRADMIQLVRCYFSHQLSIGLICSCLWKKSTIVGTAVKKPCAYLSRFFSSTPVPWLSCGCVVIMLLPSCYLVVTVLLLSCYLVVIGLLLGCYGRRPACYHFRRSPLTLILETQVMTKSRA